MLAVLQFPLLSAEEPKPSETQRAPIPIVEAKRADAVDFEAEILPVLKNNCLACHNRTKAKADLILETPQTILKGGESGPAVVPGKSSESLLLKAASHQQKPAMPPKDNKVNAADLTPEQLGLIKLWIEQGARGEVRAAAPIEWRSLPEAVNPIYAVALTPDGQFAACSRANQIFIYHVFSGQLVTRLSDPQLAAMPIADLQPPNEKTATENSTASTIANRPLASPPAHHDLVHSLAFSPDGNLLASGGYREVKLWRRPKKIVKQLPIAAGRLPRESALQAIAISPDGKWLATGCADGTITLWNTASSTEAKPPGNQPSSGTEQPSTSGAAQAASSTNTAAQKNVRTPGSLRRDTAVICLKFSPNSARLCSVSADRILRVWTVPEADLIAQTNLNVETSAVTWVTGMYSAGSPGTLASSQVAIATGGADKVIRIWQLPGGTNGPMTLLCELSGHQGAVTALEGVPNANPRSQPLLLSGSTDGSLRLWNVETGEMIREMKHGGPVAGVAVRADGKRFASAGLDKAAKLWSAEDGKVLAEMKGDRYAQEFLAATERNGTLAANEVTYRKNASEAADKQQKSATERVTKATDAFAAADKTFGEKQKLLQGASESRTTAEKALAELNTQLKKVTDDYQAADKAAQQAALEAKAAVERVTQAKLLAEQATQTKSDTERIAADAAAVASKSKLAAGTNLAESIKAAADRMAADAAAVAEKAKVFAETAAQDAAAKAKLALEAKSAAEKAIDEVAARSFAVGQMKPLFDKVSSESPEKIKQATEKSNAASNAVAAAEKEFKKAEQTKSIADHELQLAKAAGQQATELAAQAKTDLQSAESGQKKADAEVQNAKKLVLEAEQAVRTVAFSPDNLLLATAGDDRKVHTWSAETGAAFETYPISGAAQTGQTNAVFTAAFAAANTLLGASSEDGLAAWDLNPAWTLERTIGTGAPDSPLADRVNAVRFSPNGKWLATGGGEPSRSGEIILWNIADGKMEKEFRNAHSDTVLALDFSPEGKYLASGAADKFVKVIELASGKVAKSFEGHLHHVLGVSWKRDGRTLASSGADNVVKVWDFVTGERKKNIEGFNKEVTSVSFLDATDQALASSGDNQVRLVRENGESVRTFSGETDYVYSAVATPDGKIVVAGGQDSVLRVWSGMDGKAITNFPPPEGK